MEQGFTLRPRLCTNPTTITARLIETAANGKVLDKPIGLTARFAILQGHGRISTLP